MDLTPFNVGATVQVYRPWGGSKNPTDFRRVSGYEVVRIEASNVVLKIKSGAGTGCEVIYPLASVRAHFSYRKNVFGRKSK